MAKLTDLPYELLERIAVFSRLPALPPPPYVGARRPEPIYLGLVHRVFLPFSRQTTFNLVEVTTYKKLETFCKLVRRAPSIGACVVTLRIAMGEKDDNRDVGRPTDALFFELLRNLVDLQSLEVDNSHRLAELVLVGTVPSSRHLPYLQKLTIKEAYYPWFKPFEPERFQHVVQLPSLDCLEIDGSRYSSSGTKPVFALQPAQSLSLSLRGPLDGSATFLIASFPTLAGLALHDTAPFTGIDSIPASPLNAVAQYNDLTFLSLRQVSDSPLADLYRVLSDFHSLKELHLYQKTYDDSVLPVLAGLPHLERLGLHRDVVIASSTVSSVFHPGPHRLPHLKHLLLNNRQLTRAYNWFSGSYTTDSWPKEYTAKIVFELVKEAEAVGVEVAGKLVEMAHAAELALKKTEEAALRAEAARSTGAAMKAAGFGPAGRST
ncbi:hypothetical protein JCM8097_002766 [Rhodosporidiobolus ruineniae]